MTASKDNNSADVSKATPKEVPAVTLDFGGAVGRSSSNNEAPSDWAAVLKDPPCGPNSKNPATRFSLF